MEGRQTDHIHLEARVIHPAAPPRQRKCTARAKGLDKHFGLSSLLRAGLFSGWCRETRLLCKSCCVSGFFPVLFSFIPPKWPDRLHVINQMEHNQLFHIHNDLICLICMTEESSSRLLLVWVNCNSSLANYIYINITFFLLKQFCFSLFNSIWQQWSLVCNNDDKYLKTQTFAFSFPSFFF